MLLNELFDNCPSIEIKQLSIDSRVPMKDCIFFCLNGIKDNGHLFINEAINNGANVIVYEDEIETNEKAIYIKVNNVADCLNNIAPKFYDYPADKIETFLSCGCNGTNSITYILGHFISNFKKVGSIGVLGIYYNNQHLLNNVPTLTILDNQKYLNEFYKNGIQSAIFESDPISLSYKKLDSIKPNVFIFTSTNKESEDYKEISNNYYDTLCKYLYTLNDDCYVLLNRNDETYYELKKACGSKCYSYGEDINSDYHIFDIVLSKDFSTFNLLIRQKKYEFKTKLLGLNNIYNITAAIAALDLRGYSIEQISSLLPSLSPLKGIYEPIILNQEYNVIVDSGANINSIENIYKFAKLITDKDKKIYVVWGVNSSDDIYTVERLAELSKKYINHITITEKNTYKGNMLTELHDAYKYFESINSIIIEQREIAIESAIELLNKGDTLLILGKGSEEYIIRSMGREIYDGDKAIASRCIKKRLKEENEIF